MGGKGEAGGWMDGEREAEEGREGGREGYLI